MTKNKLLDGIVTFVQVVESNSFSNAAEKLGHSASYISKEVNKLEERLGTRLLNRTTRNLSLTDEGKTYYQRCRQIVIDAEDAETAINRQQEHPRGLLKLSAPYSFGMAHLTDALPDFLLQYPDVQLEVEFNERLVDLVAEGFDMAIRIGKLKDSNLIARKFMQSKGVVVASPEYLKIHGKPQEPQAISEHQCISFSLHNSTTQWEFTHNSQLISVSVNSRVICNSAELELAMALKGIGIARLPYFCCERQIESGKLVELLDDYEKREFGIYAVYPHRQLLSPKVNAMINFLADRFG
ncbi:LysR family transcriptional regulator [Aliikangiella coralliicola]|uniref:LysR family transcriptional regulator n=1 Tax=Aliikangiella coralliicola TaxID=2592383 RepID=A0A545UG78_9GAMM|nr:LysR family transcriptional regulator [Aliikangiella coralliicola]TQV88478.1 LysR family transcriptional regulator [Aliikangiella coralliicola]